MANLDTEVKAAIAQYIELCCPERPDDPELTAWERSLIQPRVLVDVGSFPYRHLIRRRPFLKKWLGKGEWCIRCCGTAALTKPRTDKHGRIIFGATYSREAPEPSRAPGRRGRLEDEMTANNPHEIAMRADAENRRLQAINADLLAALENVMKAPGYHLNEKNPAHIKACALIAKAKE